MRVKKKVAAKAYPAQGIKKGDTYYTWTFYRGPKMRSLKPPTRSQLTQVPWRITLYDAVDVELPACKSRDDLEAFKQSVENAAQEARDAIENLPENFQNSGPGETLNNAADEIDSFVDEIDIALSEIPESIESVDEDELKEAIDGLPEQPETEEEMREQAFEALVEQKVAEKVEELSGSAPDPS